MWSCSGPPGTGKTHLAMALGRKACLEGMTVRFFTAAGLVMRLLHASTEGKLDREIASIGKARLLIIDELGYVPIDEEGSRLLFQVITNAYEMQSIVYTTNIEFSGWGRVFGDPNMAAAIIDRTDASRQDAQVRGRVLSQDSCSYAMKQ